MSKSSKKAKNNAKNKEEIRQSKREEVLGENDKKSINPAIILTGLVVVLAIAAILWTVSGSSTPSISAGTDKSTQAGVFAYPVADFADGQAKYYSMKANNLDIRFFILKSSDGVIRAAFDACDVCWRSGKGYAQDGDHMVCRNCGRRFTSVRINEEEGGCNPAPLKREIKGDKLLITTADILEGSRFFNFSS